MKRAISIILAITLAVTACLAQSLPKREFRGAWLHIVGNQEIKNMTTDEIQQWFIRSLDTLQAVGCNAVIFQVRPQADAFYESELEPWTRFLTGEQGVAPTPYWDPLAFMVDECHKRGMELHAWLNPYRVTSNDNEKLHPDHLYFKNPDIFKRYGKQLYFDPGEPESIEHTVKVIADIVTRYDVDAIHFDDYFYPYPVKYEEFHDDASFAKYAADQGFEYWQKGDWRRHNTEELMRQINDTIKSIKPWIRFGISPFGIHRNKKDTPDGSGSDTNGLSNYEELFADIPAWAEKGYIDYVVPQLYWKIGFAVADYEVLINWWNDTRKYDAHLYIGQSISSFNTPDLSEPQKTQIERKMQLVRDLEKVGGNVWWPGWSLTDPAEYAKKPQKDDRHGRPGRGRDEKPFSMRDSLEHIYQKDLALIPAYTHLDSIAPEGVKSIKASKGGITWSVNPTDDVLQQPHFFVVYRFPAKGEIDLSKSECIVKITRDKSYKPQGKRRHSYKYVVTVVDKCWNESEASKAVIW